MALRYCRVLLIALWGFTFTPWVAQAQTVDGLYFQGQAIPPSPDAVESLPYQNLTTGSGPIVRGPCDPDYWIVSTRGGRCAVERGLGYNYEVFRFDGPNPGRATNIDELLGSLEPGVPVCFMAHGSFVTWDSMLNDSAYTYRWLREAAPCQRVHLIFYTWASDDGGICPHIEVNKLGRRASLNGFYLADLVAKVSVDHPICLIGHSHGTRMVASALHAMAGGSIEGRKLATGAHPVRRIRVVLAAAAIDHDWLNPNERYGLALCRAEAVINLRNRADFPLLFYPLRRPVSTGALAITGVTRGDRAELGEWNQKIIDYGVTGLVGVGHIWAHYYSQPAIASAIRHYVYFDDSPSYTP